MSYSFKKIKEIQLLLENAALNRRLVEYKTIYNLFACEEDRSKIWDTIEYAARELCPREDAIVEAVLSNSIGLPGSGFYDIYHIVRHSEYQEIADGCIVQDLTERQKRLIANQEREKVYKHFKPA